MDLRDLVIEYAARSPSDLPVRAVDGVSFAVRRGETVGLVGESGSGKTTIGLAVLGLLPRGARVLGGTLHLGGLNVPALTRTELDRLRWTRVSMAFQGAMNALNPVQRVVDQIAEPIAVHRGVSGFAARRTSIDLLGRVGISADRATSYPHELSGGMRQRAVIAMALACDPELLIADEPGTALDVLVQAQVLDLLLSLQQELHLTTLIISHDLSVIRSLTDRCVVLYQGRIAEEGPTESVFEQPRHPYTEMLVRSFPTVEGTKTDLRTSFDRPAGVPISVGCPFAPRCPYVFDRCRTETPPLVSVASDHVAACWLRLS